jgi:RNA polymerase sigma-70 factor (ECF subfamily)
LYYIEGFSIRDIAQVLEISEGAVQKRLARARGKLRQDLQEMEVLTI